MEPFDPDKTPVLFINGAGGSPQDWSQFFRHLDCDRFQPWFFMYPSGARLERSADTLYPLVGQLRGMYPFPRLHVVADSMGGLVARGFLNIVQAQREESYLGTFVSISSPWQGHAGVRLGVEIAPATIPSWIDMVPGCDYQKSLFGDSCGGKVPYYLLFGYRGDSAEFSENNDGTVPWAASCTCLPKGRP